MEVHTRDNIVAWSTSLLPFY